MTAKKWIENLQLIPHPEGGYFKENYRSEESFSPIGFKGKRNYATSIYFLLEKGNISHFHQIESDELWYYHDGASLSVHFLYPNGKYEVHKVGKNILAGEVPQLVVPKGIIFASESTGDFSLVGCMVSPGFDFDDFKLFTSEELSARYPQHQHLVQKFTKSSYKS